jgi:hypothetical protein
VIQLAERVWIALSPIQPQILAFILTLVGALLTYLFRARVKLIYGHTNNSFHELQTDTGPVRIYCEKHYIQNAGKKSAERIEVAFSCSPSELSIFPPRSFEKKDGPDGQMMLEIPYLAPNELIIVDTIHVNSRTAELRAVHCPENVGRRVEFWVQRRYRPNFYRLGLLVLLLGLFYSVQLLIQIIAAVAGLSQ